MSIQPIAATPPRLCTTLLEDPQEIANSHNLKGYLYKIAATVCAIALVAIFTGAMAIYLGMIAELPGWAVALALIAGMGCMKGLELWGHGNGQFAAALEYQAYADKYKEISGWEPNQVNNFCVEMGLVRPNEAEIQFIPEEERALAEKSPNNPLSALLPAVARVLVLAERSAKLDERIAENARLAQENRRVGQEELEFKHTVTMLKLAEDFAVTRFHQALHLHNIEFPTEECVLENTDRGVALRTNTQEEPLGYLKLKEPLIRATEYIWGPTPFFQRNEEEYSPTREDFVIHHPRSICNLIFNDVPLPQQEV